MKTFFFFIYNVFSPQICFILSFRSYVDKLSSKRLSFRRNISVYGTFAQSITKKETQYFKNEDNWLYSYDCRDSVKFYGFGVKSSNFG